MENLVQAKQLLKQVWGYDSFREGQDEGIQHILNRKDVVILMPTGIGKSLIYQIPALLFDGICLVISPLIALMTDQVEKLKKLNVKAACIHSGLTTREIDIVLDNCIYGNLKMLFLSPERIDTHIFKARVAKMNVSLLAIDEAHCISQWGHDFRPSYKNIASLKEIHRDLKTVALTATANNEVILDIKSSLNIPKAIELKKSFRRKNLHINILKTDNKLEIVQSVLTKIKGSGIIYVRHRKTAYELYNNLRVNFSCDYYHAGMNYKERAAKQQAWISGEVDVMVATNAFGMGIDKSDVRFVMHYGLSPTIEEYYQEIGRAGRDGKSSFTYLLYNVNDIMRLQNNHAKSFPSIDNIRKAYGLLHNYYELSVGSGAFHSYDFDIAHFAKYCNAQIAIVYRLIKQLEKLNFITLSQGFGKGEKIRLLITRDMVYELPEEQKQVGIYLLRNVDNIVSSSSRVNTKKIAKSLEWDHGDLLQLLEKMHEKKIIHFKGKNYKPQITFLQDRFAQQNLQINQTEYESRKLKELNRNESLIAMLQSNECRMKFILNYFEEEDKSQCGMCDFCRKAKSNKLEIEKDVLNNIKNGKDIKSFIGQYEFFEQEMVLSILNTLVDENKLTISEQKMYLK